MQKILIIVLLTAVIALSVVVVYQKLTPSESASIVVSQPVVNQLSANTNCLKEGEQRADDAGPSVPDKCCTGLVKVESVDEFSPGAICKIAEGQPTNEIAGQLTSYDPFRCTACGNGVCGKGENVCNCPADCNEQGTILKVWPDVETLDLSRKIFSAKNLDSKKIVTITYDELTKFYENRFDGKVIYFSANDFYSLLKNWYGPTRWFEVNGTVGVDNSIKASEIYYFTQ